MEDFLDVKIIDSRNSKNIRIFTGISLRPAIDNSGDYYVVSQRDDSVSLYITGETYERIIDGRCKTLSI